jgi:hypothetical protein
VGLIGPTARAKPVAHCRRDTTDHGTIRSGRHSVGTFTQINDRPDFSVPVPRHRAERGSTTRSR